MPLMNEGIRLSRKAWVAVGFVVVFYIFLGFSSESPLATVLLAAVAISTAGGVAFDSTHVHLRCYKTGISYGPVGLFVVCALFWPFVIIWYFVVRVRIARKTMPQREEFAPRHRAV